jgi:transposase
MVQAQSPLDACLSRALYRDRNAIERMFCRLKDDRRIATHYDKPQPTSSGHPPRRCHRFPVKTEP